MELTIHKLVERGSVKRLMGSIGFDKVGEVLVFERPIQLMAGYYLVESEDVDLMGLMLEIPDRPEHRGSVIKGIPLPNYSDLTLDDKQGYFEDGEPHFVDWQWQNI
jgi:hypothetical protein